MSCCRSLTVNELKEWTAKGYYGIVAVGGSSDGGRGEELEEYDSLFREDIGYDVEGYSYLSAFPVNCRNHVRAVLKKNPTLKSFLNIFITLGSKDFEAMTVDVVDYNMASVRVGDFPDKMCCHAYACRTLVAWLDLGSELCVGGLFPEDVEWDEETFQMLRAAVDRGDYQVLYERCEKGFSWESTVSVEEPEISHVCGEEPCLDKKFEEHDKLEESGEVDREDVAVTGGVELVSGYCYTLLIDKGQAEALARELGPNVELLEFLMAILNIDVKWRVGGRFHYNVVSTTGRAFVHISPVSSGGLSAVRVVAGLIDLAYRYRGAIIGADEYEIDVGHRGFGLSGVGRGDDYVRLVPKGLGGVERSVVGEDRAVVRKLSYENLYDKNVGTGHVMDLVNENFVFSNDPKFFYLHPINRVFLLEYTSYRMDIRNWFSSRGFVVSDRCVEAVSVVFKMYGARLTDGYKLTTLVALGEKFCGFLCEYKLMRENGGSTDRVNQQYGKEVEEVSKLFCLLKLDSFVERSKDIALNAQRLYALVGVVYVYHGSSFASVFAYNSGIVGGLLNNDNFQDFVSNTFENAARKGF